jgi:hypothetical protein
LSRAALACTLLLGSAVAVSGCHNWAKRTVSLAPPAVNPPAREYFDQLKKWSRYGHIQADFDDTLAVNSTLQSPEFAGAFAEKWIEVYKLNEPDAVRKRAEVLGEIADVWQFHMESATHKYEDNEFGNLRSPWRVALVDDRNRSVQPIEVKLDRGPRDVTTAFFPYATIFSRGWRVRFPRTLPDGTPLVGPDTKRLTFRISGPAGSLDMTWKLAD